MDSYSVRDVERVLRLSRSTIRGLISVGFVKPARGARRQYRFSFQDLIVLRAARALIQARIPRKRIRRSLEDLRQHLPETVPMSGLSICAVGDRVVVRDGTNRWQVDDGQYLLGLDVSVEDGTLQLVEHQQPVAADTRAVPPVPEDDWFERGLELESANPEAARAAYARAVQHDPDNVAAWINWGRLLHELGQRRDAEGVYQRAIKHCGHEPVLMFNFGVLLEDLGRTSAAIDAYQAAIGEDPNLADGHYNLARLYEVLGKPQHAIRHLGEYRRLLSNEKR
jgi:DNA-binding transcriptional MerR regulator